MYRRRLQSLAGWLLAAAVDFRMRAHRGMQRRQVLGIHPGAAVRNAVQIMGVTLIEALRMASTYPAAVLGLDRSYGKVAAGFSADLVRLDNNLEVVGTWIAGDYMAADVKAD